MAIGHHGDMLMDEGEGGEVVQLLERRFLDIRCPRLHRRGALVFEYHHYGHARISAIAAFKAFPASSSPSVYFWPIMASARFSSASSDVSSGSHCPSSP